MGILQLSVFLEPKLVELEKVECETTDDVSYSDPEDFLLSFKKILKQHFTISSEILLGSMFFHLGEHSKATHILLPSYQLSRCVVSVL